VGASSQPAVGALLPAPTPAAADVSRRVQGNQDGGLGNSGTVVGLREWRGEASRLKFGVRVKWDAGPVNTYRWGAEDAFDVQVRRTSLELVAALFKWRWCARVVRA
jgi:hypothetical protein